MSDRIEIKAALTVDDAGAITGIAWPFGSPDRVGDVIEKGAFATAMLPLPMLWAHDQGQVVGVWDQIAETDAGLTVKGRLLVEDVARAREVRAMIHAGAVSGLSIGFVTKTASPRARGRTITALDLHEISVVAVPCHPGAQITSIKTADPAPHPEKDTAPLENDDPITPANAPQIDTKAFDEIKARLDRIEAKAARPQGVIITGPDQPERKAFTSFLQGGDFDRKALTLAADSPSYVLAPEEVSGEFIRNLVEFSPIRSVADVRSTSSHTVLMPRRTGVSNALWVGETTARTGSEPSFAQSEIAVKEIGTFVDLSLRMLEDSSNVEAEVRLALAEDFGAKEATAFVNGDGVLQPQGFMTAAGIAETVNGHAANVSPDALVKLFYAMPATYRNRGTWAMNGTTLGVLRTLKDGDGRFLWQPAYQAGQPETILGRPVVEVLDMPNIAAGTFPVVFGDFKAGYRVYDRVELDILPDLLTQRTNGLARFHARRRVGGGVVRTDVFRRLKMSA
ncbi:phage major capsid protein [Cereibacter changlensis]|uniref:phage major capsid protein n=1 Tax=Cereibacter changlensis TaxID=402884 RepID=UPI004034133A